MTGCTVGAADKVLFLVACACLSVNKILWETVNTDIVMQLSYRKCLWACFYFQGRCGQTIISGKG